MVQWVTMFVWMFIVATVSWFECWLWLINYLRCTYMHLKIFYFALIYMYTRCLIMVSTFTRVVVNQLAVYQSTASRFQAEFVDIIINLRVANFCPTTHSNMSMCTSRHKANLIMYFFAFYAFLFSCLKHNKTQLKHIVCAFVF